MGEQERGPGLSQAKAAEILQERDAEHETGHHQRRRRGGGENAGAWNNRGARSRSLPVCRSRARSRSRAARSRAKATERGQKPSSEPTAAYQRSDAPPTGRSNTGVGEKLESAMITSGASRKTRCERHNDDSENACESAGHWPALLSPNRWLATTTASPIAIKIAPAAEPSAGSRRSRKARAIVVAKVG